MIYLHIGRHKTGTTSIQYFLRDNQDFLDNHNLIYVTDEKGLAFHEGPRILKNVVENDNKEIESIRKSFEKIVTKKNKDFIFSSESFQNSNPELVYHLFKYVGHEIIIISYFREPVSYFISSYKQRIQNTDFIFKFSDYINKQENLTKYIDFYENWIKYFPSFTARNFSRKNLKNYDLIYDFMKILLPKLEYQELPEKSEIANRSLSDFGLLFKLVFNNLLKLDIVSVKKPGQFYNYLPEMFTDHTFLDVKNFYLTKDNYERVISKSEQAFNFEKFFPECNFKLKTSDLESNRNFRGEFIEITLDALNSLERKGFIEIKKNILNSDLSKIFREYLE